MRLEATAAPRPLPLRLDRLAQALLALILLGCALFFFTQTRDQFELPKQLLLRALSSLLMGVLLARKLADPSEGWRRGPLDWPVLAWCAALVVGTVHSVAPWVSWRGEYENFAGSLTQLNYAFLYFAAVQALRTPEDLRRLARAFGGAALAAALYALLQALQRDFIGWSAASVVSDRFFGPLGNPNFLGGLMAMAIPLKLALATGERGDAGAADPDRWWRLGAVGLWAVVYAVAGKAALLRLWPARHGADPSSSVVLGLWLAALAAAPLLRRAGRGRQAFWLGQAADGLLFAQVLANTGTRGAFLGLLIGLGVLGGAWALRRRRTELKRIATNLLGLALLLALLFAGLGQSFRSRMLSSLRDPGHAMEVSRLQIWVPALEIWKDHPLLGTGVDSFKTVFPGYSQSRFNRYDGENVSSRMAHCEPLHVAATQGALGLAVWLWLLGAFFMGWWRRLARSPDQEALLLGVGALAAAYLGQNLVSFGVAGISAAFWIFLAFPGALDAEPARAPLPWKAQGAGVALGAGLLLALAGLFQVRATLQADLLYAYSSQAQAQLPSLESDGLNGVLGAAGYGFQRLSAEEASLDADGRAEFDAWRRALTDLERRRSAGADPAPLLPTYRRAAGSLMMLLSAHSMQEAVRLCPHEVKYHVYLGLAYEELFRRAEPARRQLWFQKAIDSYTVSTRLNPGNAYYRGNLGRLLGMGAEAGSETFLPLAEEQYLKAIELAPVTKLFYENLLLLYARYARLEAADSLLKRVEARDRELAPGLLIAAASTFFQFRGGGPAWTAERQKAAVAACLDWARRGVALEPGNADYVMALAEMNRGFGRSAEARRWAAEALRLRPGDAALRDAVKQRGLAP